MRFFCIIIKSAYSHTTRITEIKKESPSLIYIKDKERNNVFFIFVYFHMNHPFYKAFDKFQYN